MVMTPNIHSRAALTSARDRRLVRHTTASSTTRLTMVNGIKTRIGTARLPIDTLPIPKKNGSRDVADIGVSRKRNRAEWLFAGFDKVDKSPPGDLRYQMLLLGRHPVVHFLAG